MACPSRAPPARRGDALPPSAVRMPLAAWKPATSSASVKGRTRITSRPSSPAATASCAVNTIAPLAAPGRRRHALGQHVELRVVGEGRVQQRVEPVGVDRGDRLGPVEQVLLHRVDRESHRRLGGALRVARLEHEQAALLDGELGVLHVLVVRLERPQDLHQLVVGLGHGVAASRGCRAACAPPRPRPRPGRSAGSPRTGWARRSSRRARTRRPSTSARRGCRTPSAAR